MSGRVAIIEAKPEPLSIDISKTVVLVVDMQNDFGSKGGMFDRAGIDISMVQGAVGSTKRVLAAARDAGIKIIYLKMGYRPDLSDAGPPDSPNRLKHLPLCLGEAIRAPNGAESRILVRDTWNTDILSDLAPRCSRNCARIPSTLHGSNHTKGLCELRIAMMLITSCTSAE